jgi:hypothetical protein
VRGNGSRGTLHRELEHRIRTGRCVYCRAPAAPDRPLTREHVIAQARGGRRKDPRIIVPACARCNHSRGCQEVVIFLLARPARILAFLEYLATLPPATVRELDVRVFAELYAAVWLLADGVGGRESWRRQLARLRAGRRLHRRRYAARRIVSAVAVRIERARDRLPQDAAPACPLPAALGVGAGRHATTVARGLAALIGTLALLWEAPADRILEELERERRRAYRAPPDEGEHGGAVTEEGIVVSLDGWRRRTGRRRRLRSDPRRGRGPARGRAA